MKRGIVKDYGIFPDGASGYLIEEGEATNAFIGANTFMPYVLGEVHEIIPYEKQKEIMRALCKAQIEAAKKLTFTSRAAIKHSRNGKKNGKKAVHYFRFEGV